MREQTEYRSDAMILERARRVLEIEARAVAALIPRSRWTGQPFRSSSGEQEQRDRGVGPCALQVLLPYDPLFS